MKNTIRFGSMDPIVINKSRKDQAKPDLSKRRTVKPDGVESDHHTRYDSEVAFANIRATANVCRVKDDDPSNAPGVVKGAILEGVPITVPNNSAGATAHAMKKRCDHAPTKPDMAAFKEGHALLMEKIHQQEPIRVDRAMIEEYVATCPPSKAERLMTAFESGEYSFDGGNKHVFAKQEILLKDHGAQPRIIYQGTDMYNLLTGCVVSELQRRLKTDLSLDNPKNTGNRVVFACGMSGEALGDVIHSTPGEMAENDFENNDGTQAAEFRKYEAMLYWKKGAPLWFVREFAKNKEVRVWTRFGIEATVKGQRWSGETTTTPGNTYVGAVLLLAAASRAKVVESTHIHGGDDFLGIAPAGEIDRLLVEVVSTVASVGMKAKVLKPASREHGTFYRKRYVDDGKKTRPVPQFGRVLAKLNIRANCNTSVDDRQYMAGKYYSAAYEHRFVPGVRDVLMSAAERMSEKPHFDVRLTKLREMGDLQNVRALISNSDEVDVDAFSQFLNNVYGIGYEDLIDAYGRIAESCVAWLDGYTYMDKKGKVITRAPPPVQKIGGDTIAALLERDV